MKKLILKEEIVTMEKNKMELIIMKKKNIQIILLIIKFMIMKLIKKIIIFIKI